MARPVHRLDVIALGVVLTPFLFAVVRAVAIDWMPVGDAAYFTARSRDVLGSNMPLVGAWSSGSEVVGRTVNNLGPLQLDALAPFTLASAYLGTAVGTVVVNVLAVVAVWFVAVRLCSPGRVVGTMTGVALLVMALGPSWLIDPRQQLAMVLPFLALLWLCAGMVEGLDAAVPLGVLAASFVAQTHFSYVVVAAVVFVAGLVGWGSAARRGRRIGRRRHVVATAAVVAAVCWIQPLIDQVFGSGNLGAVLDASGEGAGAAGFAEGLRIVAGSVLVPPFWLPGSFDDARPPGTLAIGWAIVAVVAWLAVAVVIAAVAHRRRCQRAVVLAGAAAFVLLASILGAAVVPETGFGLVPQNYYWLWAAGAFATTAMALAGSVLGADERVTARSSGRFRPALLGALGVVAVCAMFPRQPLRSIADDEEVIARIGVEMRQRMARSLAAADLSEPVVVDLSRAGFGNLFYYVLLVELQRAGIEFRFAPGDVNLPRFGANRCTQTGEGLRLALIGGPTPQLDAGSVVLTSLDGTTAADDAELGALDVRFGSLLRSGDVRVDTIAARDDYGVDVDLVADVLADPDRSAGGLAGLLGNLRAVGLVEVPPQVEAEFQAWVRLDARVIRESHTVALIPAAPTARPDATCPE